MKDEIRRRVRLERDAFQGEKREIADVKTAENFLSAFARFNSFFVYNSFGGETDTARIISELLKLNKCVCLPRVEGENIVPVPFGKTVKGAFGVAEPTGQAFSGDIDVTVIPLIAVNGKGYRAGYGKGFYDRYLKGAKTLRVGLCYDFQRVEFEEDSWDEPLDFIVTESEVVKVQ